MSFPHSYHNSALLAVGFVKLEHLFKRVVANYITVQHKEGFRVHLQALLGQCQWTSYRGSYLTSGFILGTYIHVHQVSLIHVHVHVTVHTMCYQGLTDPNLYKPLVLRSTSGLVSLGGVGWREDRRSKISVHTLYVHVHVFRS